MGRILPILVVNKNKVFLLEMNKIILLFIKDVSFSVTSNNEGGWSIEHDGFNWIKVYSKDLNKSWRMKIDRNGVWDLRKEYTQKEYFFASVCLFVCAMTILVPFLVIFFSSSNDEKNKIVPNCTTVCQKGERGDRGPQGIPGPRGLPGECLPASPPPPPPAGVLVFHRGHVFEELTSLDEHNNKTLYICGCHVCVGPVQISKSSGEFDFCINPVLEFQSDGNLVLYDVYDKFDPTKHNQQTKTKRPLWATGTDNKGYTKMYYHNKKFHFL